MCLAEGSLMVYPKIRPGVLFLGHLVGARDVNKMGVQFLVGVGGRGGVWANVTQ